MKPRVLRVLAGTIEPITMTHGQLRTIRFLVFSVSVVFVASACSLAGGQGQEVEVTEGSIPSSFPRDFPIPGDATIGETMIDRVNHRSEATLSVESELVPVIQYFQLELVGAGYVVDTSDGDESQWRIEFFRDELRGSIDITVADQVAVVFISMNVP